jgi:hypothetical protein
LLKQITPRRVFSSNRGVAVNSADSVFRHPYPAVASTCRR